MLFDTQILNEPFRDSYSVSTQYLNVIYPHAVRIHRIFEESKQIFENKLIEANDNLKQ